MKIEKNEFLISFVLIINILLITIPFTFKNHKINSYITKYSYMQKKSKSGFLKKDPINTYKKFNNALNELNIQYQDKEANFTKDSVKISILIQNDISDIINLIGNVEQDFSLISCNIEKNKSSKLDFEMRK